ncbi:hypothetical protein PLEOSDRAFT_1108427 [Pleurotus ostreatus PC15]|uniref:Uncharacterized protein n=1 Tax=Pleurotus ostreatus (strain PC15) TaxID=1137138 RepID=A0A067NAI0_PLEO1|nr:hypothetical protein PLEOSDRAFT_1108427 [Pleurotus ostreatus PC15]
MSDEPKRLALTSGMNLTPHLPDMRFRREVEQPKFASRIKHARGQSLDDRAYKRVCITEIGDGTTAEESSGTVVPMKFTQQ